MNKMTLKATVASAALAVVAAGAQAEKWDMPMAYAASNYHSEMGVVFADKVRDYTGGDVDITVHAGGSLFKGGEIKRAVQTGQAPIGERLMSAHTNEEPLLGWDNLPFLATSYAGNDICRAPAGALQISGGALFLPVAGAGVLFQEGSQFVRRHTGREVSLV